SEKRVVVVPTRSQQAGLAAAIALDPSTGAEDNAAAIGAELARVRTGAVAPAARDDANGRFSAGEAVGFVGEEIVAWGDPAATVGQVIAQLSREAELVTCLRGADAPLADEELAALAVDGVELELATGGQPTYWYLLSAE